MCGIINVLLMRHPVTELASHSRAPPAAPRLGAAAARAAPRPSARSASADHSSPLAVSVQIYHRGHAVLSGVLLGSTHRMRCLFDP